MHQLTVYYKLARAYIRGQVVQHRWGIGLYLLGLAMGYGTSFFGIWIILDRFNEIGEWQLGDIAFIYIICLFSAGFSNMLFVQFRLVSRMVESGDFDRILIRPINPVVSIMGSRFELNGLSNIFVGVILMILLNNEIGVEWTVQTIGLFILALVSATLVHGAILLLIGGLSIIFIRTSGLDDMYSTLRDFVFYPVTIFHKPIQFILFFILPLAFVSYVPAGIFLDNPQYDRFPQWIWNASPIVGAVLFFLSYQIWSYCLRHYQSTGS